MLRMGINCIRTPDLPPTQGVIFMSYKYSQGYATCLGLDKRLLDTWFMCLDTRDD